jgi:hypothetical protein
VTFAIPPKPASFSPQGVAPGCRRIPNLYDRPLAGRPIDVLVVHTNWASREGTIESAVNWSQAAPGKNTYAHYQHDLDGDAAKMLDTDRRGIGNSGTSAYWSEFNLPNASYRALVFETADRGTNVDPAPEGSYFTDAQMASLARDLAYECVVHGIPPVLLPTPDGRGIAGHTYPFPYPAFTTASSKKCPGYRKNSQLVGAVIPWTAAIVRAWTAPPPTPPEEDDDMPLSDADVQRVADAVWDRRVNVVSDGVVKNVPVHQAFSWIANATDKARLGVNRIGGIADRIARKLGA